jgi:xylulokinase
MTEYVIGCDVGSQGTKVVLLSLDGTLSGEASESYGIDYPHKLWAEQPVSRWTTAVATAIQRLLAETGVRPEQVRGLGLATQVDGVVPVDRAGQALRPAIIWMDRRATVQCDAVGQVIGRERALELTGLNLDATHVAPKIRWIAEMEPEVDAHAAHFLLPGSYMAYHLTGEIAVDYSNASSTLLMDVRTRSWSSEMCELFAVDAERLGRIDAATAPLGTLRASTAEALGLRPETLVVVGCGDEHAACLGAGVVRPGLVADIAGTAEPVCAASPTPLIDPSGLVETHCHSDPELWLLENPGFVSGGNLRWYRDHFGDREVQAAAEQGISPYALLDAGAAQIAPGADGMIFLPCLMGAMAPTWNDTARGTFFGFTLAHTRSHFTRAVLEGSAYAVRDITDQMRTIGLQIDELRVMGGGARSRLWNQIKADVTGLLVTVPQTTETTAVGGALLALVGLGTYKTLPEACNQVVRVAHTYAPRPGVQAAYDELYHLYREVYFSLLPVFSRAAGLGHKAA